MNDRHSLRVFLAALALMVATLPQSRPLRAQEQETPPARFPSEVQLITVDALVLDSAGRPVRDLTKADFVVTEDGRPRDIASFEAPLPESAGPEEEAPAETPAVVTNEPAATGRAFVVLVDDLKISAQQAEQARQTVTSFLEKGPGPGDEVTLGTTSGDLWWSTRIPEGQEDLLAILKRVKGRYTDTNAFDRMTEYEAFWINAHEQFSLPVDPRDERMLDSIKGRVIARWISLGICPERIVASCDAQARARATDIDTARVQRTRLTMASVRRGLEALSLSHGRKSLLLFSPGFLRDSDTDLREIASVSREARSAVYFIDLRGLEAASGGIGTADDAESMIQTGDSAGLNVRMRFEESVLGSAGTAALADETGGFSVRNTNDMAGAAQRIVDESRAVYLLGFYPVEGKSARDWRKLKVEVKRPGLTVRARQGYSLRGAIRPSPEAPAKPGKEKDKDKAKTPLNPMVARALDSAHDVPGIPLRAMVFIQEPGEKDKTHVLVSAAVDTSRLEFQPNGKGRSARLDVSVVATERDTGGGFSHNDPVEMALNADETPGWRGFTREFELPPGVTQVRVIVRDTKSGALGSVSERFEVPRPDVFRVSTPVLSDVLEPAKDRQSKPRAALAVYRTFPPQGGLYIEFEAFGAARAPDTGAPKVSAGFDLKTHDRLVRTAEATPITPDSTGRVVRLMGMKLDGLEEGPYELVLKLRDEVSGARIERVEAFTLSRNAAAR
jgi:VWFA-related protein